jgi:hypothetical protein
MTFKKEHHRQLRLKIVEKIVHKWSFFENFIMGDSAYPELIHNAPDYRRMMKEDGTHGGHAELHSISQLFLIEELFFKPL